ncbi:Aspartic proteinase nepenthesin-1 [Apostasia shenzhenica]|uniref:Aspartic proteinase nepenthesin-1 n=1 Tax=Apostasia shenzhenica TaxID=1088818 RepID=A0A2I0AZX6_9ASPA|nr:Aspartic proteinase nepenthesin-1 [Apostasia shenzhenica]
MASPYASSFVFFFLLTSLSTSSTRSHHPYIAADVAAPPHPLLLPLTHSLSHSPQTHPLQLIHSSSLRSAASFRRRRRRHGRPIPLPLSSGSDYTLSLSFGSSNASLFMDTGSDLVWLPCSPFQCILCDGKPFFDPSTPPPPRPPSSAPLPCSAPLCSSAHSSLPLSDLCAAAHCPLELIETSSCSSSFPCPQLYYAYGDGSLIANLLRGPVSFSPVSPISASKFTFACAHSTLAEPLGVAGFGPGPLSLPSQLAQLSFSYCLVSHSFLPERLRRPSPLILGRSPSPKSPFVYTPILPNPKHPYFYSVSLLSISVGRETIPASPQLAAVDRNGDGGMVVDSGTTFTMLPANTHRRLSAEFHRQMARRGFTRAVAAERRTGLWPCYRYRSSRNETRRVPSLALHFAGNASVRLPPGNYFLGFESEGERVGCLMVMSGGDEGVEEVDGGGPAGTLGNFQQQGMEVVYDIEMGRVGFARRRCDSLWDSVSRG